MQGAAHRAVTEITIHISGIEMDKRRRLPALLGTLLNRLLLILIVLVIASIFSVLLIKGVLFKEKYPNVEPHKALAGLPPFTSVGQEVVTDRA
jgi:hypothetical protein